jgi:hypothetical protein
VTGGFGAYRRVFAAFMRGSRTAKAALIAFAAATVTFTAGIACTAAWIFGGGTNRALQDASAWCLWAARACLVVEAACIGLLWLDRRRSRGR